MSIICLFAGLTLEYNAMQCTAWSSTCYYKWFSAVWSNPILAAEGKEFAIIMKIFDFSVRIWTSWPLVLFFFSLLSLFRGRSYARTWLCFIDCNPVEVVQKNLFSYFWKMLCPRFPFLCGEGCIKGDSIFLRILKRESIKERKNKILELPFIWWIFQQSILTFERKIIFKKVFKKNPHVRPCSIVQALQWSGAKSSREQCI